MDGWVDHPPRSRARSLRACARGFCRLLLRLVIEGACSGGWAGPREKRPCAYVKDSRIWRGKCVQRHCIRIGGAWVGSRHAHAPVRVDKGRQVGPYKPRKGLLSAVSGGVHAVSEGRGTLFSAEGMLLPFWPLSCKTQGTPCQCCLALRPCPLGEFFFLTAASSQAPKHCLPASKWPIVSSQGGSPQGLGSQVICQGLLGDPVSKPRGLKIQGHQAPRNRKARTLAVS